MDEKKYREKIKSDLREAAFLILNDEGLFVERVRSISDKLQVINVDKDIELLFKAISSDTDDIPTGEMKLLWKDEEIERLDKELQFYIDEIMPQVKSACLKIINTIDQED